ncbi:MAG TPA: GDSL-type esterase/lipase family protein [Vicinamibacterales bacterium]|nr:GDSL-type esterase/lipase family protein [Vicinamibacterales bacterium]
MKLFSTFLCFLCLLFLCILCGEASAQSPRTPAEKWVASWAASAHGPYPVGNAVAQPELKFAFPAPAAGASNQTFRLIVRPDLWGDRWRIRLTNLYGTQPVTFDEIYIGVQATAGNLVAGSNRPVRFSGKPSVTIPPGEFIFSDPVTEPDGGPGGDGQRPGSEVFAGRKLAVSFHVVGESGPMTWHAKALQTSYITPPGSGAHGMEETDASFPFTTTSWYFMDAVDVRASAGTQVICAFGDSITDGTASTINGDDRWPDVLSRRLHAAHGSRVSVVNAGIGGNRILTPAIYTPAQPFSGGPAALQRFDRDVLGLSGLTGVVFLEGVNDISSGSTAEAIIAGIREIVSRVRARGHIKIVGATVTPAFKSNGPGGTPEAADRRRAVNNFVRTSGLFDAVADFEAATLDPGTGSLKAEFQPNSSVGGPGDLLHPNRAGYQAMGNSIDLRTFAK